MNEPLIICLIGAECTGKTTLTRALAAHFDGLWVDEYLRTFCTERGRTPTRDEQALILETQVSCEAEALALARRENKGFVFCDTAPLLTAIYSEFIFADSSLYRRAHELHSRYAMTLHLVPDIPWIADGIQRDGAHARAPMQALIERELIGLGVPHAHITGVDDARIQAAITALRDLASDRRCAG
jgi:nicotinamide riboside kinase